MSLSRNELLLRELERTAARIGRAWEYLAQPGCNRALAEANLARGLARYAATLEALRANQAEARWLLGRPPGSSFTHAQRARPAV